METKEQIRKRILAVRNAQTGQQRMEKSRQICDLLLKSPLYQKAEQIGAYYPLGSEVSLKPLMLQAWQDGKKILLPKVEGEDIFFYETDDFSQLREGAFHVMEPQKGKKEPVFDALILTPGVVFDRCGARCGYGRGFYDRFYKKHPAAVRLGVAMECQLVECLPVEQQDVGMQYMVTEQGMSGQEEKGCS